MRILTTAALLLATTPAFSEIPKSSFFSGNDVYEWCQREPGMALSYTAGQFDAAVHGAYVIDSMRNYGAPKEARNDAPVDIAIMQVAGFCVPEHATPQQVTDIFCKYLRDTPAERDGLPSIILNKALTQAWPPCH
jgi:hypothetical protein